MSGPFPVVGHSAGGYTIDHSLRFRASNSAYLSRSWGGTGTSAFTLSLWVKRGNTGTYVPLLTNNWTGTDYFDMYFSSANNLVFNETRSGVARVYKVSSAVYRDPSAWYHIVFSADTSLATAEDRFQIWVNGSRITAWGTNTNTFPQGGTTGVGDSNYAPTFFKDTTIYSDLCAADIYLVSNAQVSPSAFGEFNSDGVWIPKKVTGLTYGTNGFYLDFKDGTSATTLGYDAAGSNDWTPSGISTTAGVTYDWMVDTPSVNYAVLNPIYPSAASLVDANLSLTTAVNNQGAFGTLPIFVGEKSYFEATINYSAGYTQWAGIRSSGSITGGTRGGLTDSTTYAVAVTYATNNKFADSTGGSVGAEYGTAASGDVLGIAVDRVNNQLKIYQNNTLLTTISIPSTGDYYPAFGVGGGTSAASRIDINFGQRPFAYTPPTGFKALCTANLPTVAITNPSNGFKVTLQTEDNIYSAVASARSGWTDYVDLLINRSAGESRAWQFSHDSTNEYAASANSLVRQAKRAMSGSNNWVGYSIRIGSAYGTAAGSVSHTNGAATTVTHNLGTARQVILLFRRTSGTTLPMYHPDGPSGQLSDIISTGGFSASTVITSVGSNSFQIGSSTATDTYDYLVISETSGLFKAGKYTGNGLSDGPFVYGGLSQALVFIVRETSGYSKPIVDAARDTYNVAKTVSFMDTAVAGETSANIQIDFTAFGWKARDTDTEFNSSGVAFYYISFGKSGNGSNIAPSPAR